MTKLVGSFSPADMPPGTAINEDVLHEGHRLGLTPSMGRPAIPFANVLKAEALSLVIPNRDDHITGVPEWNLGANNRYGTCGPTSLANYISMCYWNLLGTAVTVSDDAIFALYKASGNPDFPAQDNGVDLNYMLTQSLDVGLEITYTGQTAANYTGPRPVAGATELVKPVCFGSLEADSCDELRATTAVLGGVEMGVTLEVSQQTQLNSGVWDYSPSGLWGGHAIMGAAYTGDFAEGQADEEIITWAEPVGLTDAFITNQLSQAYGVVLPIHLTNYNFLQGVDTQALAGAYQDLTGRPFPGQL